MSMGLHGRIAWMKHTKQLCFPSSSFHGEVLGFYFEVLSVQAVVFHAMEK